MNFHDIAQYEEGVDEPERTGEEAWNQYQSGGVGASAELGIYTTARFVVQGVFTGDDRDWNEVVMVHMPSEAGFEALLDDDTGEAGRYHRYAALEDNYSMITYPTLSTIPTADGGGTGDFLKVTEDGVGTICTTDADCPGNGVDRCLAEEGSPGFCTREGCGAGDCLGSYVCCRECAEQFAPMLPFDGSACMPGEVVSQLSAPPLACTCD